MISIRSYLLIYILKQNDLVILQYILQQVKSFIFNKKNTTMDCLNAPTQVQFIAQKWEQGLGEQCLTCKNKITARDCISLCKCYLFCHQHCFLTQFSPFLRDKQRLVCARCGEEARLVLSYFTKWQCNKKPLYIVSLIISILSILALIILAAYGLFSPAISTGGITAIILIMTFILIGGVLFSMRKRYINLEEVRVVNSNLLGSPETSTQMKKQDKDYSQDLKIDKFGASEKGLNFDIS